MDQFEIDRLSVSPDDLNLDTIKSYYLEAGESPENVDTLLQIMSIREIKENAAAHLSLRLKTFLFKYAIRHYNGVLHMGNVKDIIVEEDVNAHDWEKISNLSRMNNIFSKDFYNNVIKNNVCYYIDNSIVDEDDCRSLILFILQYIITIDATIILTMQNCRNKDILSYLLPRIFLTSLLISDNYQDLCIMIEKFKAISKIDNTEFMRQIGAILLCNNKLPNYNRMFGDTISQFTWDELLTGSFYCIKDVDLCDLVLSKAPPPTEYIIKRIIQEKNEMVLEKVLALASELNYQKLVEDMDENEILVLLKYIKISDDDIIDIIPKLNNSQMFVSVVINRKNDIDYLQKIFDVLIKKGQITTARTVTYQCQINIAENLRNDLFPRADMLDKRKRASEDDSICMICHADVGNCSGMFYFISCCNHIICDICYSKIGHECPMCKKCNMQLAAIVD